MPNNINAILVFSAFVFVTLVLTWRASKRVSSQKDFYTAGASISARNNGLAIAGDAISAAAFLGMTAAVYSSGFDPILIVICPFIWGTMVLLVMSDRFRNLGNFTFVDVIGYRLKSGPVRIVFALGGLVTIVLYLTSQLVAAGRLLELLFGLNYALAVFVFCLLVIIYVAIGGMLAATWIQMFKAVLLVLVGTIIVGSIFYKFEFSFQKLIDAATATHAAGDKILEPGLYYKNPGTIISTMLTLIFGFMGLPHVLVRLFTVKDAKAARKSIFYATSIMGYFAILIIIMGYAAISILADSPAAFNASGDLIGGRNMVTLHLTQALMGDVMLGIVAAIAFATILAVVSGLIVTGGASVAHDLYKHVIKQGEEVSSKEEIFMFRAASVGLCLVGFLLALAFQHQNILFISVMALAIAASLNFPVLFMAMYWKGLTTRGVVIGGIAGLVTSVLLTFLSQNVMVDIFGYETAIFPYSYPTIISLPVALFAIWLFSVTDKSKSGLEEKAAFASQRIASEFKSDTI